MSIGAVGTGSLGKVTLPEKVQLNAKVIEISGGHDFCTVLAGS